MLPILQQLTTHTGNLNTIDGASFDAAVKVAWAGFLHCGEFTLEHREHFDSAIHLSCSSIELIPSLNNPSHLRLCLPSSNTDPFRKGVSVLIAKAPSTATSTCTVAAL